MGGLRLQYRLMFFLILLIVVLSLSMNLTLLNRAERVIKDEFVERANSITKNLSVKSELGILIENKKILNGLINDLLREKDVLYVKILNKEKQILAEGGRLDALDRERLFVTQWRVEITTKDIIEEEHEEFPGSGREGLKGIEDIEEPPPVKQKRDEIPHGPENIGSVEIGFSTREMDETLLRIKFIMGIITSAFILIGIVIAYIFSKGITRPINELVKATQKIAHGELTYELKLERSDEVGILAKSFNIMTKDLKRHMEQLEKLTNQLEEKVKERTRELEDANLKLQESNIKIKAGDKMKSEFLARMSHELRTPLNAILGFSGVILSGQEGPLSKDAVDDIQMIESSGKHLLALINNILDLTKIEVGKMELLKEKFGIDELIKEVITAANILVKDKDVKIISELEEDIPPIEADKTRIKQVIFNLVSNAARFTDKGSVTIRARLHRNDEILVSVSDTGIGIKTEDLPNVFNEFSQIEAPDGTKRGGTGLGLAISKKFVEMHNGRIWVESKPGVGSTFYFAIPIPKIEKETIQPQEIEQVPEEAISTSKKKIKTVMVIDDDLNIQSLYSKYLKPETYNIISIMESEKAVEQVISAKPDVIILDILMPKKTGWEIIADLKKYPETEHIPLIISSIIDEKGRGFALGAKAYLLKPIQRLDLIKAIDRINRELTKILIIDDNITDVKLLQKMLEDMGHDIFCSYSGRDGIRLIHEIVPDLIILDLMMPEIDGFAVLEEIKGDPKIKDIPIIIVTAKDITYKDTTRFEDDVKTLLMKGTFTKDELVKNVINILKSEEFLNSIL